MTNLTLKQMQKLGVNNYMSDKEIEKQLAKALNEQQNSLEQGVVEQVKKVQTLDEILKLGGVCKVKVNNKQFSISVITGEQFDEMNRASSLIEEGYEYDKPTTYRYHIKNAHDNYVTVKAKSYTEAQSVIDQIYGKGVYKISASSL